MAPFYIVCDQIDRSEFFCTYLHLGKCLSISCIALKLIFVFACWKNCTRTDQMTILIWPSFQTVLNDIAERPQGFKKVINPCHQFQEMETIDLTEDDDLDLIQQLNGANVNTIVLAGYGMGSRLGMRPPRSRLAARDSNGIF